VPLDERMVLCYLADAHCPERGCITDTGRLSRSIGVAFEEVERLLDALEARGMIARYHGSRRVFLAFEAGFRLVRGAA
jgi:DNA-binding MarR family transcriptional regulator